MLPTRPTRRTVTIADDHLLVRAGVRSLLEASTRYQLVAEADDLHACLQQVQALQPDLLLLDIVLPDGSGLDAVPRVRAASPATRIVLLSAQDARDQVMRALQTGVEGFLSKDFARSELELAFDSVLAGGRYLSPRISNVLVDAMNSPAESAPASGELTGRQREVLRCIAHGRSNKEIARELAISPKTVEFHRGQLMQRLDLHDVASLTRYAMRSGLV
jgi:DNA-binding NarL/FixJ family response regulator